MNEPVDLPKTPAAPAKPPAAASECTAKKTVQVILGGGGAKGFAHVGVLEGIINNGYTISSIVGTSVGSLVGGLYAHIYSSKYQTQPNCTDPEKKTIEDLKTLCAGTNFNQFKDFAWFRKKGLFHGDELESWLETQLLDRQRQASPRFSELAFDFTATATDALTGLPLTFNARETPCLHVHKAIRASASIQGVFAPILLDYHGKQTMCWDGGNVGNCRLDLAETKDPDLLTVASSLTYRNEPVNLGWWRFLSVLLHSNAILMKQMELVAATILRTSTSCKILIIDPPLQGVGTLHFGISAQKKRDLFEAARAETERRLAEQDNHV